jgi:hypothetical protein
VDWLILGALTGGAAILGLSRLGRRTAQVAVADASGMSPVGDLTHVSPRLQQTALWHLADGGFERRAVHGVSARATEDVDVTAFDLETLRERRGEWAWLPIEPPFRVGGLVSVVVCELSRELPHLLFKRAGRGDDLRDDHVLERAMSPAKLARDGLGLPRSYAAELPAALPPAPLAIRMPELWHAYGHDADQAGALVAGGLGDALALAGRRDLVVELLGPLVVVYPAAHEVFGADALADLTEAALAIVDGVIAASRPAAPRGLEPRTA